MNEDEFNEKLIFKLFNSIQRRFNFTYDESTDENSKLCNVMNFN